MNIKQYTAINLNMSKGKQKTLFDSWKTDQPTLSKQKNCTKSLVKNKQQASLKSSVLNCQVDNIQQKISRPSNICDNIIDDEGLMNAVEALESSTIDNNKQSKCESYEN